jgi:hypothetical protein
MNPFNQGLAVSLQTLENKSTRFTLVQISFSPADLDSIRQVQSGSHQSRELLKGP